MKIDIGSGNYPNAGFTSVDLYWPAERTDDARTLATFENDSAEEILASHVLEHLGAHEAPVALAAWYRVLAPGGLLTVVVPDIVKTIRKWLAYYDAGDPRVWGFRSQGMWGNQVHDGEYHKWGYDENALRMVLTRAGFVDIVIVPEPIWDQDEGGMPPLGLRATARKPR